MKSAPVGRSHGTSAAHAPHKRLVYQLAFEGCRWGSVISVQEKPHDEKVCEAQPQRTRPAASADEVQLLLLPPDHCVVPKGAGKVVSSGLPRPRLAELTRQFPIKRQLARVRSSLRNFFNRQQAENELDEEVRSRLELVDPRMCSNCLTASRTQRTAGASRPMCLACSDQTLCFGEKSFALTNFIRPGKAQE
jgi:hypothetical protein